ncbi:hypothetical protein OY34_05895 [Bacillus anthracis]|uniref:Uncharacterized protein n=1 Tax=Bacillus cereus (strain 03BB102) TaxID=572264 RepID=A0A125Y9X6_BACC3|nr:conserved hypothetical protein [Bacillus cereus 03BB102]ACP17822.1 conserved hypothetical protein [Bacillus anthracis str. CDC 684]ADK08192.1 hypothetical protein BACI_pCIXO101570 [Bacillus cereus biovar anthracis str. CI]AFH87024.1 Hypothetical Protein H9401_5639 [Bacillus anthracis str. H9401]AHE87305.2 hypothetical protein A16R_61380 [Bacillus anthracis str. A16R]AHE93157.1 hypothetical protein A16_60360 [Bacillus anthracis str. A16]AHK41782.1 hypothetical protein BAPAT_pXO10164 [Bacill
MNGKNIVKWSAPPEDEDRQNGSILSYHPHEETEWFESYLTKDGIKLEISNFLSVTVERLFQMWWASAKLTTRNSGL